MIHPLFVVEKFSLFFPCPKRSNVAHVPPPSAACWSKCLPCRRCPRRGRRTDRSAASTPEAPLVPMHSHALLGELRVNHCADQSELRFTGESGRKPQRGRKTGKFNHSNFHRPNILILMTSLIYTLLELVTQTHYSRTDTTRFYWVFGGLVG